jgi:putative DNA primase/helicase
MGIEAGGDFLVKAVEEINEKNTRLVLVCCGVGDKELSIMIVSIMKKWVMN